MKTVEEIKNELEELRLINKSVKYANCQSIAAMRHALLWVLDAKSDLTRPCISVHPFAK